MARSDNAEDEEVQDNGWCKPRFILAGVMITLIITAFITIFGVYGSQKVVTTVIGWVPKDPGWETLLTLAGINYVCCVLCLAFWGLGQMVVAFVFGFYKGFLINFCTLVAASCTSFVLGRYLFRDYFRRLVMKNKQGAKAAKIIEREDIKFLILFRALPMPLFLKNYLPPVLKVSFLAFLLSVLVGGLIYCPIFAMIGAGSQTLASLYNNKPHGEHATEHPAEVADGTGRGFKWDATQLSLAAVALVAMVGLSVFATLEWRKVSDEAEPLDPDGMPRTSRSDMTSRDAEADVAVH